VYPGHGKVLMAVELLPVATSGSHVMYIEVGCWDGRDSDNSGGIVAHFEL
ncbi:hypothetical protein A2U01_0056719, partial [Trifolium medium]|nr:hypothetical protein [Trifolium medium]